MNNYGNNTYLAHGMKYFVTFVFLLIVSGAGVLWVASGNIGPKADADAEQVRALTRTQEARDAIDTKFYAQQREREGELESKLNALRVEQQKRLNDQEIAQNQNAHERWQALLEVGMWIVATGAALAMVIAAGAFAYKAFEQARAARQEAKWQVEARTLQSQILRVERQLQKTQAQLYALEQNAPAMDANELVERLAQLEAHLNALQMWRLEHSSNGAHALKNLARSDTRDFPRAV
jgi:hypothetical protein